MQPYVIRDYALNALIKSIKRKNIWWKNLTFMYAFVENIINII